MAKITAIEQARRPKRFNLYVDHHLVLRLSAHVAARLRVGQELSDDELKHLADEEAFEAAYEKALRFLEPRPRSASEVKHHLLKKKIAAAMVERVLARLTTAGLLDDRAFAEYWVENREQFSPRAARALRFELKRKGLAPTVIEQAIAHVDERASAYRAGLARAKRWRTLDRQAFLEKVGAFLMRRGFEYTLAKDTAQRLWQDTRTDQP